MSIKILLVDDESSLLEQAKIFLEKIDDDLEVSTVSSAEKALELLDNESYDFIVSDYQMPVTDGLEFLEEIREERESEIPFIMFTGKGREEVAMKALNLGADRYIKKEGSPKDQFEFLADAIIRETIQFETKKEKEEREQKIRKLYEASIVLGDCDSEEEIYQHVLKSFKEILEFQGSSICMGDDGGLIVKATDAKYVEVGEKRSNDEGIRGLTYQNQRSYLIDDLSEWEEAKPADPKFKSVLSIPIKDKGVYQALSYEKNYFDEFDLEMAEILISHMWQVIEGIKYQNELEMNRVWLSQIVENSTIPTFVIDKDHKVTHWNRACENLTGIPKNEVVDTKEGWKAFYDEERPVMADLVLENAPEKEIKKHYGDKFTDSSILSDAYEAEDFFSKFKGGGRWVYFTAAPIKDDEGNRVGAIETLQDITESKETEEKLKRSEKKFRKIFENFGDPVIIKKLGGVDDGDILDVNRAMSDMLGYSSEELLEMNVYDDIAFDDPEKLSWDEVKEELKEGNRTEFTVKKRKKDGSKIWVEVVAVPIEYEGENAVLAVTRDVTERKRRKIELQERIKELDCLYTISNLTQSKDMTVESILQEIVENIPPGFSYPVDTSARITFDGQSYGSESFEESSQNLSQNFSTEYGSGEIEVYVDRKGESEDVFLEEEKELLDSITVNLENFIERRESQQELKRIEWMLSKEQVESTSKKDSASDQNQGYGDLTDLNEDGMILQSLDKDLLKDIVSEYLDMLETSSAIYEKNGDYAF